jgi:hypothetical protein
MYVTIDKIDDVLILLMEVLPLQLDYNKKRTMIVICPQFYLDRFIYTCVLHICCLVKINWFLMTCMCSSSIVVFTSFFFGEMVRQERIVDTLI